MIYKSSLLLLLLVLAFMPLFAKQKKANIQTFQLPAYLQIRAIATPNDATCWFAANRGTWGFTNDYGKTWKMDSIKLPTKVLEFRSIAVLNDSTVLLLTIGSPSILFKTTNSGKSWKSVYMNLHKDSFFDCLYFTDAQNGWALGDPIEHQMQLIQTTDAGEHWLPLPADSSQTLNEGEAFFAASNTSMKAIKNKLWIASGGSVAQVFYKEKDGKQFQKYATPLQQGQTMTGIFSIDFFDELHGVIAGGNYDKTDSTSCTLAYTDNGGFSWLSLPSSPKFFGSCVQFISKNKVLITGHNGTFFYDLLNHSSNELLNKNKEALKFNTCRISASGKSIWMAGRKGSMARISHWN
jgi:photosystem II stability/assembly factor-like uncharacterized protein